MPDAIEPLFDYAGLVAGCDGRAAWQLSDGELASALVTSQAAMSAQYAAHLELVTEAESRGLGSHKETAGFLVEILRVSWREARARVAISDSETLCAALADGGITPEHAAEIAKILAQAPDDLDPEVLAEDEAVLLRLARQSDPGTVKRAGQRLTAYWDADGKEPADRERELARPLREFRYHWTLDGRMKFTGEFDRETGLLAENLFTPLAKPDPKDEHGDPDPRTKAERQGDAVAAIFDLAARAPDLPTKAGERAVATVTIPLEDLKREAGLVVLDSGEPMSTSQLRRLLCDAKIYPAVLGGEGQVLDLGRSARTANPVQRRALVARDKGCTRPGCDRDPKWTTPHHIVHWAHGGDTDLDNQALVCERDHPLLHHGGWEMELRHGVVYWIPPPWIDQQRRPIRNTAHDPPRHHTG